MATLFNRAFTLPLQSLLLALFLPLASCTTSPIVIQSNQLSANRVELNHLECVVLVHGLWRSSSAMTSIKDDLKKYGYQTINIDYPSTEENIPALVKDYLEQGYQQCAATGAPVIHFVTHSLGGILVRQFLQSHRLPEGGKVVMLSPPNKGSELSEKFGSSGWYQWLVGPAGVSLSMKEGGLLRSLNAIKEPLGIIAAYRDWSLWPESWLPTPNDGTVSVQSTKLPEMDDFIMINSGHSFMRFNDEVHSQIRQFLAYGAFLH